MEMYSLFTKFTVKAGERDTFAGILMNAAAAMNDFEECILYLVSVSEEEQNTVFVYETWENERAHQASLQLEETQTAILSAKPLITGVERISTVQTLGGKGL